MRLISVVAISGLLVCSGCGKQAKNEPLPENEDETPLLEVEIEIEIPENDKKKAIEVARSHLDKDGRDYKKDEFSVTSYRGDGDSLEYWVYVEFRSNVPGGHCSVVVSHDFKVKYVMLGY